jgi:chemosensory pili system protein ChpA (sensor histidine kinase/response regulator)
MLMPEARKSLTAPIREPRAREKAFLVNKIIPTVPLILIVEDVHETRDGLEKLLTADGYRVSLARDEQDAIDSAQVKRPDLILVSLAGFSDQVIVAARRIRENADVGDEVPIVIFCVDAIGEGSEVRIEHNVYLTRPDNFNQLRRLLARVLPKLERIPVGC